MRSSHTEELGKGTFGTVIRIGDRAVKQYKQLNSMIQEHIAFVHLRDCDNVVSARNVSYTRMEIDMECFDMSLREWILETANEASNGEKLIIVRHVLLGLIELHDRRLVHGDIKPGNILLNKSPLRAVLGDLGFVSYHRFSKCKYTARAYRDVVVENHWTHDIYSLGIIFLEIFGKRRIMERAESYAQLDGFIGASKANKEMKQLLRRMLGERRTERPSARDIYQILFNERVVARPLVDYEREYREISNFLITGLDVHFREVRKQMREECKKRGIRRGRFGFCCVVRHCAQAGTIQADRILYVAAMLVILSAILGDTNQYRAEEAIGFTGGRWSMLEMKTAICTLANNEITPGILYL